LESRSLYLSFEIRLNFKLHRTEPALMTETLKLIAPFLLFMKGANPHNEIRGSNPSPGAFLKRLEASFIAREDGFTLRKHSASVEAATLSAVLPRMMRYIYTEW
jgi:hypothetical protein